MRILFYCVALILVHALFSAFSSHDSISKGFASEKIQASDNKRSGSESALFAPSSNDPRSDSLNNMATVIRRIASFFEKIFAKPEYRSQLTTVLILVSSGVIGYIGVRRKD